MILVLSELKPGANRFVWTSTPEDLDLPKDDPAFREEVSVTLEAIKQVNLVELHVQVSSRAAMVCSRCGEIFHARLQGQATYLIRQGSERLSRERTLSDEDILTLFTTENEVDTLPLIREVLLLEVPMRPLCRDDCQGLCPVCGTNWNETTCEHRSPEAVPESPRKGLAQLADLWAQLQEKTNKERS